MRWPEPARELLKVAFSSSSLLKATFSTSDRLKATFSNKGGAA